ncbi:MAG: gamma-glutamylcyclotransferase [Planctomycetaceae bacterium]
MALPGNHCDPGHRADALTGVRLFVYGTLKRGYCRNFALAGQTFLGEARTRPGYRLYDCGDYPALVRAKVGCSIRGELWDVSAECLERIDVIEGVEERWYERGPVQLEPPHEQPAVSYFFLGNVAGLRLCEDLWP